MQRGPKKIFSKEMQIFDKWEMNQKLLTIF